MAAQLSKYMKNHLISLSPSSFSGISVIKSLINS